MTEGFGNGRISKLDPKKRASAHEILDAAALAFSERGYAATSIDDVADVLGCTKGRIYHYFRTKGDLFIGIHHQALEWALEAVGPAAERDDIGPEEKLREMVHQHAMHLMNRASYMGPAQMHIEVGLAAEGRHKDNAVARIFEMRQTFESYYVKVMEDGVEGQVFRDADINLLVKATLGIVNWMHVWFQPDGPADSADERHRIAGEIAQYAVRAVLA
ncbi:TetR/AcrR family transcriptional regulator [Nocardia speluncae]|uniref:TetR/AcrR family transcriptional regulator n=1 Tax=Nocardia speluncae TaxID=419477 RepID=A0A846XG05_9NOCA|nr:TetR/AcrR family transcriptional regulator [Nocardia speluncae]NKY32814.1 TetR/AcrR family transcriptional regulator [Nocardia speluncae]